MPTGYTSELNKGEQTFKDFALQCARAFGANVMMRDDPWDAQIRKYEPSDYYLKEVEKSEKELARLIAMSFDEVKKEWDDFVNEELAKTEKHNKERDALRIRYQRMIDEVKAWTPPTPDHQGLKNFMLEQLTDSMEHDCYKREFPSKYNPKHEDVEAPIKWHDARIANTKQHIEYYKKEHKEEVERCNMRNAWNQALMDSLTAPKEQGE